jgi:hypothetical protein
MLYVALLSPDLNPTEIILIAVQGLSELQQFRSNSLSGEEFKGLIFVNTFLSTVSVFFFKLHKNIFCTTIKKVVAINIICRKRGLFEGMNSILFNEQVMMPITHEAIHSSE